MADPSCFAKLVIFMEKTNLFKLIHSSELISNENIVKFSSKFAYPVGISAILVLAQLRTNGPKKQTELADILQYSKGAITNISSKLVKFELAERLYDEEDRRTIHLKITAKGQSALIEAQKLGEEIYVELFEDLTEEELAQYLSIQRKILYGMKNKRLSI